MWVTFANAKATHIFFSKNTCELDIVLTRTVNILTTNEIVKQTMLWTTGPRWPLIGIQIKSLLLSSLIQQTTNWWYFCYFSQKTLTFYVKAYFLEVSKPIFLEKRRKVFQKVFLWNFYSACRVLRLTLLWAIALNRVAVVGGGGGGGRGRGMSRHVFSEK